MISFFVIFLQLLVCTVFLSVTTSFVVTIVPRSKNAIMITSSLTSTSSTTSTSTSTTATTVTTTQLSALYTPGRSSSRNKNRSDRDDRSKRQFRVGELVKTELALILHTGIIKGDATYLDNELRQRISIVSADVSPDLRQARVSVSIRGTTAKNKERKGNDNGNENDNNNEDEKMESELRTYYENDPVVDKRRAYSWLVDNSKPIRHTLAQKMSHMKTSPTLTFVQVDVAAATDVMYLIDKVTQGYQRESIGEWEDFNDDDYDDDDDDDDGWDEMDDDFFKSE